MNGRRRGAVDFLSMVRLEIAATDQLQKDVARAAGLTPPDLTRIFHGQIPLTDELKARIIVGLHRETLSAAPEVVRGLFGANCLTDGTAPELATAAGH